jgi:hypothetical protein
MHTVLPRIQFVLSCSLVIVGFCFSRPASATTVLAGARIHGPELSEGDLLRGVGLHKGQAATAETVRNACRTLGGLRIFYGLRCSPVVEGENVWLDLTAGPGMPVVFDNFVWITREDLTRRLKEKVPLFMPTLADWGLNDSIVKALNEILAEDHMSGSAVFESFWAQRGKMDFVVSGIKVPVASCRIVGDNAPTGKALEDWKSSCMSEEYSAARRALQMYFAVDDLYRARGYMNPKVGDPETELMPSADGSYPVRVLFKIDSGPLYRFDSIAFIGLLADRAENLGAQWTLKPGEVFDEAYVKQFGDEKILSQPWSVEKPGSSYTLKICERTNPEQSSIAVSFSLEKAKGTEVYKPVENVHCHEQFSFTFDKK